MEFIEIDISEIIPKLDKLTSETKPLWGDMSAQRMFDRYT